VRLWAGEWLVLFLACRLGLHRTSHAQIEKRLVAITLTVLRFA
jgi:hypothetical protein